MTHEGIEITVVKVTQEDDYSLRVFTLKVTDRECINMWNTKGEPQQHHFNVLASSNAKKLFASNDMHTWNWKQPYTEVDGWRDGVTVVDAHVKRGQSFI